MQAAVVEESAGKSAKNLVAALGKKFNGNNFAENKPENKDKNTRPSGSTQGSVPSDQKTEGGNAVKTEKTDEPQNKLSSEQAVAKIRQSEIYKDKDSGFATKFDQIAGGVKLYDADFTRDVLFAMGKIEKNENSTNVTDKYIVPDKYKALILDAASKGMWLEDFVAEINVIDSGENVAPAESKVKTRGIMPRTKTDDTPSKNSLSYDQTVAKIKNTEVYKQTGFGQVFDDFVANDSMKLETMMAQNVLSVLGRATANKRNSYDVDEKYNGLMNDVKLGKLNMKDFIGKINDIDAITEATFSNNVGTVTKTVSAEEANKAVMKEVDSRLDKMFGSDVKFNGNAEPPLYAVKMESQQKAQETVAALKKERESLGLTGKDVGFFVNTADPKDTNLYIGAAAFVKSDGSKLSLNEEILSKFETMVANVKNVKPSTKENSTTPRPISNENKAPVETSESGKNIISQEAFNALLKFDSKENRGNADKGIGINEMLRAFAENAGITLAAGKAIPEEFRNQKITQEFANSFWQNYHVNMTRYIGSKMSEAANAVVFDNDMDVDGTLKISK